MGSYSPVQRFVRVLKKSSGTDGTDAFIPLYFAPGDALQFNRSEEYVLLKRFQFMLDRQYPATPSALSGHWRYPCFNKNWKRSK